MSCQVRSDQIGQVRSGQVVAFILPNLFQAGQKIVSNSGITLQSLALIKLHGSASARRNPKKSISLVFVDDDGEVRTLVQIDCDPPSHPSQNRDLEVLGLHADHDWILYAPYGDRSYARNAFGYRAARDRAPLVELS